MKKALSIIIPVLNEQENIVSCLLALQPLREKGAEIIMVDGGSSDQTCVLAAPYVDHLFSAEPGRARQMNAGASVATGQHYLFLHADTRLPSNFSALPDAKWGFFPVRLSGAGWPLRIIERAMNMRSRITHVGTGDQAIFVDANLFQRLGGFADIPLMEDVEFCGRLRKISPPALAEGVVETSSRRWEQQGIVRTVCQMWYLRLAYFMGASPYSLVRRYYS